jgi:hypothetical protein
VGGVGTGRQPGHAEPADRAGGPSDPAQGSLHRRLIPHLGFAIGELFDFAPLARVCQREGRYEFLFTGVPLNLTGAVGSPANAVAIV